MFVKVFGFVLGGMYNCFMYVDKAECKIFKDVKFLNGVMIDVSDGEL